MTAVQCEHLVDALMELTDASLPSEQVPAYRKHLENCPRCREFLRSYAATTPIVKRVLGANDAVYLPARLDVWLQALVSAK